MASKKINVLLLLFMSMIASSTFVAIKLSSIEFSPVEISFGRTFVAALVLWPFALHASVKWPKSWNTWVMLVAISLLGTLIPFTLLNWAAKSIDSAVSGILWSTLPIFGVILSHIFTQDDRLTIFKILSVLLGGGAVLMVTGFDAFNRIGNEFLAQVSVLGAAFCYAMTGILQRRLAEPVSPVCLAIVSMTVSAVVLSLFSPWEGFTNTINKNGLLAILYLGLVTTALLHYLRFVLIRRAGYAMASYTGYLVPIISVFWGVTLLQEELPPLALLALTTALLAVFVSQLSIKVVKKRGLHRPHA